MSFARNYSTVDAEECTTETKPCVVLVDDHLQSRLIGKKYLSRDGFDVLEFGSGAHFLSELPKIKPDIILLDVMMPQMSGYTVCQMIRSQEQYKTIPILMLTGLDDLGSITEAYDVGATDFVTKPINWVILQHRLRYMMRSGEILSNLSHAVEELNQSRSRLSEAQRIAKLGHWQLDEKTGMMFWSDEVFRILSYDSSQVTPSKKLLLDVLTSKSCFILEETLATIMKTKAAKTVEVQLKSHAQSLYLLIECRYSQFENGYQIHGTVQDITERKSIEHELWRKAYYCPLTLLPNRRYLLETLESEIYRAKQSHSKVTLLLMDFQKFRHINQTFGHAAGDHLLQSIAQRLETAQRSAKGVFLSRLGSDQFLLLCTMLSELNEIETFIHELLNIVQKPYYFHQQQFHILANVGICQYPQDGLNSDDLLKNVQVALEYSKGQMSESYYFYNAELTTHMVRRLRIEEQLRLAIVNKEFQVFYQPKLDMKTHLVVSAEALLRWNSASLGSVSPVEFIPVAEECGLINEIGFWVLNQACSDIKKLLPEYPEFIIAVNISAQQFYQGNFVETVMSILDQNQFPPVNLELELTETVIMQDIENTSSQLQKLLSHGIRSSIDDFGTGYSSLNYLKCLPISKLKIDRSFVSDVDANADSQAIVKAIIAMSHNLNLEVVAEGVETESQRQFCQDNECDEIQGYLISRPIPRDEFIASLRAGFKKQAS